MNDGRPRLILFTRSPVAGRVKTRLIPALGQEGAAALHRRLVLRTFRTAYAAGQATDAVLEIRFDGDSEGAIRHWLGFGGLCRPQIGKDLGERMAKACEAAFGEGSPSVVIMGSDCPKLTPELLATALDRLSAAPVIFGPANDGGYYLMGLSRMVPELFRGISWGQETVLTESLRALERLALSPQCGFASTMEGNRVTVEDEKAKLRLVVETAREVWGTAS